MRSNGMRRSVIGCARWRNTNARCAHYAVCRARSAKAELTLHAETSVCWATAHMQQAMKRWTDANGRDNPAANALTAHLTC